EADPRSRGTPRVWRHLCLYHRAAAVSHSLVLRCRRRVLRLAQAVRDGRTYGPSPPLWVADARRRALWTPLPTLPAPSFSVPPDLHCGHGIFTRGGVSVREKPQGRCSAQPGNGRVSFF